MELQIIERLDNENSFFSPLYIYIYIIYIHLSHNSYDDFRRPTSHVVTTIFVVTTFASRHKGTPLFEVS
jgi:hypothetical protein